jgi:class 3 adenylate cyclase
MASVVFADLVGSTGIFERLGDETAGRFVTQLTGALAKIFEQHNGRVVKMLGDGLFVVFPEDPRR